MKRSLLCLFLLACGGDDTNTPPGDGGKPDGSLPNIDGAVDGAQPEAGTDGATDAGGDVVVVPFVPFARAYGALVQSPGPWNGDLASDPNGAWIMGGGMRQQNGTLAFGGPNVPQGAFLAKVDDSANMVFTDSFVLVNPAQNDLAMIEGVVTDASGNIFAVGTIRGAADFFGTTIGGGNAAFVIEVDPAGKKKFVRPIAPTGLAGAYGRAIAIDASGNIYVAFEFFGNTDFGGGSRAADTNTHLAVAKYDSTGAWKWDRTFGTGSVSTTMNSITVDAQGVAFSGTYDGATMDFGSGVLTDATSSGNAFYCVLDPSNGNHIYDHAWGGPGEDHASMIRADGAGGFFVAGSYEQTVDFGKGNLTSNGGLDVFVAHVDASHATTWAKHYGDNGNQWGPRGLVDSKGNVHLIGYGASSISFGGNNLNLGPTGTFAATLDPNGAHVDSKSWGGNNAVYPVGMARDPANHIGYFGGFKDPLTFASGSLNANNNTLSSFFLATYAL